MAGKEREVNLVIRAKEQSKKAIDAVSAALDELTASQKQVAQSSVKAGNKIEQLKAAASGLEAEIKGLSALGKVAENMDRAAKAVGELDAKVKLAAVDLENLNAEQAVSAKRSAELQAAAKAAREAYDTQRAAIAGVVKEHGRESTQAQVARKSREDLKAAYQRAADAALQAERAETSLQRRMESTKRSSDALQIALDQSNSELRDMATMAQRASAALRGVEATQEAVARASAVAMARQQRVNSAIRDQGSLTPGGGADKLRNAMGSIYGESRQAMNMFQRLRGEVLALTSSYVGLYAVIGGLGSVIRTTINYQGAFNKLMVVTGNNSNLARAEMAYLETEANRLGITFTVLAGQYASFADAAQGANFSMADTRKIFKSVAEAGVVMNVSAEDMQGIFKALGQIMSKGKVQAEELRGQLGDRMTGAFRLMADALGVTTGELDKMLQQGEVVADRSTLVSFADKLTERYGKQLPDALKGMNTEIGRWQNNFVQAQKIIGEAGFNQAFTESLREINNWFQSSKGRQFFTDIGVGLGKLTALLPEVLMLFRALVPVFQLLVAFKMAQVFTGLASSLRGLFSPTVEARSAVAGLLLQLRAVAASGGPMATSATAVSRGLVAMGSTAVSAAGAFRALWAAMGGLPGMIITALTTLAVFVLPGLLTGTDKLTRVLQEHEAQVNKVAGAYLEAADEAEGWKKALEGLTATELARTLDKLQNVMGDLKREAFADYYTNIANALSQGDRKVAESLRELTLEYRNTDLSAAEFKRRFDELIQAHPEFRQRNSEVVDALIDFSNRAVKAEKAVNWTEAALAKMNGTASQSQSELVSVANAAQGLNAAMSNTSGIDAYTAAMDRMAQRIPALKRASDLAAGLSTNKSDYAAAAQDLYSSGGLMKMPDRLGDPANAEELRGFLGPSKSKKLDALLKRYSTVNAATNEQYAPKAPKKTPKSDGEKQAEKQAAYNAEIERGIAARTFEISQLQRTEREQEVMAAIEAARVSAQEKGLVFSAAQEASIRKSVEAQYDANQAAEVRRQIDAASFELMEARGQQLSREQYVMRELGVTRLDNLTAEQQKLAVIKGQIYDIAQIERQRNELDKRVSGLEGQQQATMDAIDFAREQGDGAAVAALEEQLRQVNAAYREALLAKRAFWASGDGKNDPAAAGEIQRIDNTLARLKILNEKLVFSGKQINEQLAKGLTDAFDNFAQAVAEGENVWEAFGNAFRQFAAEFLREIARMIMQQVIFNIVSGNTGGGGGVGKGLADVLNGLPGMSGGSGWASGGYKMFHSGGVVGTREGTLIGSMSSLWNNAQRYHGGGVVGLKSNERAIVTEVGEGVFTEEQMSAIGRGMSGGGQAPKIVNLFEKSDLAKWMLEDQVGQKVFLNFIRNNRAAFKQALG